jgi:hypothetical protein
VKYPDLAGALGMFLFGIMAAFMIIPSKDYGFLQGPANARTITWVGIIGYSFLLILCSAGFAF